MDRERNAELDEYLKRCHESYLEERNRVESESLELGRHYDTWLMTLCGGALLLSVACIEKLFHHPPLWSLFIVGPAWFTLACALGCQLRAISRSQTGLNEKVSSLDYEYQKIIAKEQNTPFNDCPPPQSHEYYATKARRLNSCAFWLFIIGVVLLSVFSMINLRHLDGINTEEAIMAGQRPLNESRGTFVGTPNAQPVPRPTNLVQQGTGTTAQPPSSAQPSPNAPSQGGTGSGNSGATGS